MSTITSATAQIAKLNSSSALRSRNVLNLIAVWFSLDGGFFDFDGMDNYQNQTAPIFDSGSSSGLSAAEVFFSFAGVNPKVLRITFAPDAFALGDRLQFAADIDGLGSKLAGRLAGTNGQALGISLRQNSKRPVLNLRR
jgi:hypothetical protein